MTPITTTDSKQTWKKRQRLAHILVFIIIGLPLVSVAIESGIYRILSVSDSIKLILISQPANNEVVPGTKRVASGAGKGDQTIKYVLDASAAKITVNGKPAEFKDLKYYAAAQVKFQLHKETKEGIPIDGKATEIKIIVPPEVK
jgi:hypothetical protein